MAAGSTKLNDLFKGHITCQLYVFYLHNMGLTITQRKKGTYLNVKAKQNLWNDSSA